MVPPASAEASQFHIIQTAGREVEQNVFHPHIRVQQVLLAVLQQRPARAVNHAFRRAGRPRGKKYVERMVERKLRVADFIGGAVAQDLPPSIPAIVELG